MEENKPIVPGTRSYIAKYPCGYCGSEIEVTVSIDERVGFGCEICTNKECGYKLMGG